MFVCCSIFNDPSLPSSEFPPRGGSFISIAPVWFVVKNFFADFKNFFSFVSFGIFVPNFKHKYVKIHYKVFILSLTRDIILRGMCQRDTKPHKTKIFLIYIVTHEGRVKENP